MMQSPRQQFRTTETAKAFLDISASAPFQEAVGIAFSQYASELAEKPEAQTGERLAGAKRCLEILSSLSDIIPTAKPTSQNLTWT